MLSLSQARKEGRLQEFIAQEEARGVGPLDGTNLDAALEMFTKQPRSADQTSHSPSDDDSTGT